MSIHILTAPKTTKAREKEQLAELDKYQRRYLSRRICALCDHPLNRSGCGAVMGPACPENVRIERRERCLAEYQPRPGRRRDPAKQAEGDCGNCHRCLEGATTEFPGLGQVSVAATRMILCPTCGNKRCPKASNHRLACTGSNEPGQPGSVYSAATYLRPRPGEASENER